MCGRAYYIDGIRYFGSYPRGHPLTIRPENYGRRMVVASPSPQIKREETPAMKRESSPPPEPKVKTEPSSPSPPPAPIQRVSSPMRPLKRRLSTPTSHVEGLQPPAPKKLKQESGDSEGAKALRGRSLTPWSPIPDSLQPSLKEEDEKMKVEVEDLREEMGIQEHLNDALKEENAAAVAYAKKLEEQVRGLKTNVRELRERLRGITWELEDERQEKREKKEQVRGLQNDVKGLREQVHGLNKELEEKDGREREEKAEKKRVKRRKMDTFWDGRVFD